MVDEFNSVSFYKEEKRGQDANSIARAGQRVRGSGARMQIINERICLKPFTSILFTIPNSFIDLDLHIPLTCLGRPNSILRPGPPPNILSAQCPPVSTFGRGSNPAPPPPANNPLIPLSHSSFGSLPCCAKLGAMLIVICSTV